MYLKEPSYLNQKRDPFGHKIVKKAIYNLASKLVTRLSPDNETINDVSTSSEMSIDNPELSLQEQLISKFDFSLSDISFYISNISSTSFEGNLY